MSSYIFLVRDMEGGKPFEKTKLCEAIRQMEGIYDCKEESEIALGDMVLECEFSYNEDATIIYVPVSLDYVTVGGVGEASLEAALRIKRLYREPLIAVLPDDPSCNADLTDVQTVEQLREHLEL